MTVPITTVTPSSRPRVEGDREREILAATLAVLAEVGYDRLTMDAVAARSRSSKATLYRRWNGKGSLVVDAMVSTKQAADVPDTGTLRGDLITSFCGVDGLTTRDNSSGFASVITALCQDEEFATAFRRDVIGPKLARSRLIFERARDRGELRPGVDLDLVAPALAGIVLHRMHVLGTPPDEETVLAVIDQIILPAVLAARPAEASLGHPATSDAPARDH
jgi:AcrR family transcriptional regulator